MPTVIDGTVIRGAGAATKNIKFQLTHLVWQFPDIKEIHPGSINVRLDQSLQITSYDYTTLPIPWWDVDATHPGRWVREIFSFVEIKFEYPQGGTPRRAWIFDCHNSAYFSDPVRFRYEINLNEDRWYFLQPAPPIASTVKVKNPKAPAVKREAEEDWGTSHWIRSKITRREPS